MDFFLVDVKNITASAPAKQIDKAKVEKLADAILECNGLLKPLILKPTGPENYVVIKGNSEYYAAVKAREKDPRKGEMVNAFVISPKAEQAISKQLDALENQDQTSSGVHRIESNENSCVRKNSETIPAQTSLASELTPMMQEMEKRLQTFMNKRFTQLENRSQFFFNEQLAKLENKILEETKKTNIDADIQNGAKGYNNQTVRDLKVLAKERKIKRYSSMRKAELIDALEKSDMT